MAIISAWRNLPSSKLKKTEVKFKRKSRKQKQLLSESGFVLRIAQLIINDGRVVPKRSAYFLHVLCSELIICSYNMDIKDLLSLKVILGYELMAKVKLIAEFDDSCNEK